MTSPASSPEVGDGPRVAGAGWSLRGEPARRRRNWLRWALAAAGVALVFALGVALGQALEENPDPASRPETRIRTLSPVPLPLPPPRTTVTVTVPEP